jgi:Glutathione S-transferase, N-terminal domain
MSPPGPGRGGTDHGPRNLTLDRQNPDYLVPPSTAKGEQHSDAYRAINPLGVVPPLVLEDGAAIGEVLAIWHYPEELCPIPPLFGSTPKDKHSLADGNGAPSLRVLRP